MLSRLCYGSVCLFTGKVTDEFLKMESDIFFGQVILSWIASLLQLTALLTPLVSSGVLFSPDLMS